MTECSDDGPLNVADPCRASAAGVFFAGARRIVLKPDNTVTSVSTVAGVAGDVGFADGSLAAAKFHYIHQVAMRPGDPSAGQAVFQRSCASCHKLGDSGHAVGPDLSGLRNQPADALLLHIVVPNREVYPSYAFYQAETKDGQTHAGILEVESLDSVTLVLPLGQRKTIPRSNLKSLRAMPLSLMPDGLEQTMSRQELVNPLALIRK